MDTTGIYAKDNAASCRILKAYQYLRDNGIIHTQQDLADKMGVGKDRISKALKGYKGYLTESFILKFNNAFNNIFNTDWLMEEKGEMMRNNQSVGDISNSSVHGVNVSGKDIHLECPFDKGGFELLVSMIQKNQENIDRFQNQIDRLITLLEKKYE